MGPVEPHKGRGFALGPRRG